MSSKDIKFAKKNRPVQTIKSKANNIPQKEPQELFYDIEKILEIKTQKGKKLCRIKWLGWEEQNDITWEPFQNIPKDVINQYYKNKKKQNDKKSSSDKDQAHNQQEQKSLKTQIIGSLVRRPKIVIPQDDSSLSHIEQSSQQNDQSIDKQSQYNEQGQNSDQDGSLFSYSSNNRQTKSPQKTKLLRGNQHITLRTRLRDRGNKKSKPGKKKRKLNEFSDDQEEDKILGRKSIVIGKTKIKYPINLQTTEHYPEDKLYLTQILDPDYQKYVRGYIDHINSSGQFSESLISVGDISDAQHEQGDSYQTERSQLGIPQNTLDRIITKLQNWTTILSNLNKF